MAYEIVTKLKCITNKKQSSDDYVLLTVGEIYDSACSNSPVNATHFYAFDDEGDLGNFSKEYFEVVETKTLENTGWIVKCRDCCHEISLEKLKENNNMCPKCGQKFNY